MPQDEPKTENQEIAVFISNRDSICDECGESLGKQAWIRLASEKGALCLACADLDHLAFLPSGSAALTRRAKKYSGLTAVVLHWSRSRNQYERQGLLVEEEALVKAELECLNDGEARERKRLRAEIKGVEEDEKFIADFAARTRELFPRMPKSREKEIAVHACQKYSGRVGRSALAKDLEAEGIRLAVIAHIRHAETNYDELLMQGFERPDARLASRGQVDKVLAAWENEKS